MKRKNTTRLLLVVANALFLTGCATGKLWEEGRFARFHEPAAPPNLRLAYSQRAQDVLVQYDEVCDEKTSVAHRAYFLYSNRDRIAARRKPRFVNRPKSVRLVPIELVESPRTAGAPFVAGLCAVVSTDGQSFTLYTNQASSGSFDLPVYADASGRVKQVLLTPPAVAVDLTIVGAVLAYWWLPAVVNNCSR